MALIEPAKIRALSSTPSGFKFNINSNTKDLYTTDASIMFQNNIYTSGTATCTSGTATCTSFTDELNGLIGEPLNQYNMTRIKNIVTSHINLNEDAYDKGWIRYGTTGAPTIKGDSTNDAGTGSYYTEMTDNIEVRSNSATGAVEILFSGNIIQESEEERKKREKEEKTANKIWQMRSRIRSNLFINIKSRAKLIHKIPENEQIAIETLREVITETEFRKYLKYGFVLVKGKSGKTYQIFRNTSHTKVWSGGKLIEEICVKIADYNIPPTDNVIAVKTMLETSEEECYKLANVYKMEKAA
jgi:hypothetical protein